MNLKDQLDALLDATAFDSTGAKIGAVRQVYVDDASGKITFATVATGLFSADAIVPLHGARLLENELHVDHTRDVIRDSPRPDDTEDALTPDQEVKLLEYYGIEAPVRGRDAVAPSAAKPGSPSASPAKPGATSAAKPGSPSASPAKPGSASASAPKSPSPSASAPGPKSGSTSGATPKPASPTTSPSPTKSPSTPGTASSSQPEGKPGTASAVRTDEKSTTTSSPATDKSGTPAPATSAGPGPAKPDAPAAAETGDQEQARDGD